MMDDHILDEMDRLLAQSHLDVLMSGEATAADRQAARMYLASKGHTTPSLEGDKKSGESDHPALRLASWNEETDQKYG